MKTLVSVVVPFYNEEDNVPLLAERVDAVFQPLPDYTYEGVYVNDGSSDGTHACLDALAETFPSVRPLHLERNAGQSAALMAGIARARGAYIVTLDGDLQNDPADIPRILELLQDFDCVCGYRAERRDTWVRKVSSYVANAVLNTLLRDGIRDSGCGIKGFHKTCAAQLPVYNGVHRFFAVYVRAAGFSLTECPVAHHPREHGSSKYGIHNRLWRGILDLFGAAWLRRRLVVIRVEGEE